MIIIATCDCSNELVDCIEQVISDWFNYKCVIKNYSDNNLFVSDIKQYSFDFCFIELDKADADCFIIADRIRACNPETIIIFASNEKDLIFDALPYQPFGFINKTDAKNELIKTLNLLTKHINKFMIFPTKNGNLYIPVKSIIYSEILNHTLTMHTADKSVKILMTMDELEKELENYEMIRVHKSYLVNRKYIDFLSAKDVILKTGQIIPLSKKRVRYVKEKLKLYKSI